MDVLSQFLIAVLQLSDIVGFVAEHLLIRLGPANDPQSTNPHKRPTENPLLLHPLQFLILPQAHNLILIDCLLQIVDIVNRFKIVTAQFRQFIIQLLLRVHLLLDIFQQVVQLLLQRVILVIERLQSPLLKLPRLMPDKQFAQSTNPSMTITSLSLGEFTQRRWFDEMFKMF